MLTFLFVTIHRPAHHQLFLIRLLSIASLCDLGALIPWSISPGFCSLLFLSLPSLSSFTNKDQVGVRVYTHLNKELPTKLQIYDLSAVCNCTYPEVCPSLLFFVYSSYLELNLAPRRFSKHHHWGHITQAKVSMSQYTRIHLSQDLAAVCFLLLLFCRTKPTKDFLTKLPPSGGNSLALLGKESKNVFSVSAKKINWHSHTHTHLHTRFPPLTIFYLLVNVPNYSVKQCQRFAAWHAYWNGNAAISEWKSFIHWLLSGFIHDNLLFTCRITLMIGLKGGVCVAFLCFHPRDSCPGERGPHFCCLQLSPLFRRRGLDLVLYHSHACWRALPAI